jgi:hypothetical protein
VKKKKNYVGGMGKSPRASKKADKDPNAFFNRASKNLTFASQAEQEAFTQALQPTEKKVVVKKVEEKKKQVAPR